MSDTLIIRLLHRPSHKSELQQADSHPTHAQWLLVDATGSRLGMVFEGLIAEAATLAVTRRVVVLVPGTQVLMAEPVLPAKRGAQLDQMARYALEESSASDIDELHIAIGKRGANGNTPVVLVPHSVMTQMLAALDAANIQVDAIYAETDVVPAAPNGNCVVIDHGVLYWRHGNLPATALEVQPLDEALQLALGPDENITANLNNENLIYITQADYEASREMLEKAGEQMAASASLQIKTLPEGPLPLFALQAANMASLNLLAGPYVRKKSWDKTFAPWRVAAVLAGVALLLFAVASGLQFWRLGKAEAKLDREITDILTQTLPGAPTNDLRNARKQFEARLGVLQSSRGGSGLMHSLDLLGSALQQVPEMRIETLAFRTKVLDLRVTVPSVDALDRIQRLAAEHGIVAEIQSATPRDSKVEGRLQLKASNT